eukprot:COSAG02_NODE_2571_length_8501_cov_23.319567_2_plen_115_part_00
MPSSTILQQQYDHNRGPDRNSCAQIQVVIEVVEIALKWYELKHIQIEKVCQEVCEILLEQSTPVAAPLEGKGKLCCYLQVAAVPIDKTRRLNQLYQRKLHNWLSQSHLIMIFSE